ncbi:DNA internalization-related competence protein ComEC/Rec2 [Moraxellaceae bacterium AER2_44_116]|nr:DNA internalization-related competence protein ComEC/Rec2 [Moraxellaceae bacterium]TQC96835.1 DNA internalization-related competence protein ComEC/Rec2 [Moraxellaceae bacterium AER2_44_116]
MERVWLFMALGAVSLVFLPTLPSVALLIFMALTLLVASLKWPLLRLLAVFLLSMSWSVYHAQNYLNQRVPSSIEGKAFRVLVKIEGLPEYTPFGQKIRVQPLALRSRLVYNIPPNTHWLLTTDKMYPFRPNQHWQLSVTLKRPHGIASAGAFDYEAWLLSEGVTATGKIGRAIFAQAGERSFDEWRLRLREKFQQAFGENVAAGVSLALLTGDRALVPATAWDLYAATGTSHLMAISGTHVMLAAMMAAWFLSGVLKRFPSVFLHVPLARLRLPLVLTVALAYGCLAGLSLPTLRTLVMVMMSIVLAWFQREVSVFAILLRAFVLIVLWQPLSVHAIGFWLSFMAVAVLVLWSGWQREEHQVFSFGRLQLWLTLALVPLTLCFFGRLSLVSPIANFVAIPVITFGVVPLDLLALVLGGISPEWQISVWRWSIHLIDWLNGFLSQLSTLPYAQQFWVFSPSSLVFFALSVLVLLLPKGVMPRYLAVILLLPVYCRLEARQEGTLRLSIIDVGQGLSVLLQTQHHSLLYDTGANTMAGERIITPYLRWSGVSRLDRLMISHNDSDHTGGADALLAQIPIQQVFYSALPEGYTLPKNMSQQHCQAGQHWQWEQVHFAVLSPIVGQHYDKDNNRSCVLRVSGQGFSVLLTGDMETPAEKILLDTNSTPLASQILLLGHHGSKTSTSPEFLAAVNPQLAIVSAGYRNQFGHPSAPVIERLNAKHITIDNTITQGTLIYQLSPTATIQKEVWRERGHYWLNSP